MLVLSMPRTLMWCSAPGASSRAFLGMGHSMLCIIVCQMFCTECVNSVILCARPCGPNPRGQRTCSALFGRKTFAHTSVHEEKHERCAIIRPNRSSAFQKLLTYSLH